MKKKIVIIAVCGAVALMTTLSIIMRNREKLPETEAVRVMEDDFIREVSSNGEIVSETSTALYTAVNAKIASVPVRVGDRVAKGESIILLDRESLQNSLESAENALENAERGVRGELLSLRTAYTQALTSRDQARREFQRTEELHKIDSASDEELRQRREALLLAEENLRSARQKLNFREGRPLEDRRTAPYLPDSEIVARSPEVRRAVLELQSISESLEEYRIAAPAAGVITELPVEEGGLVTTGLLAARIQDPEQLKVEANIDEVDLSYIQVGQTATITSDSFIGSELSGTVAKIAPVIRKIGDSRVCAIDVKVGENPGGIARIGASASLFIIVEKRDAVPAIPVESYFFDGDGRYVQVLTPSPGEDPHNPERFTVERRKIETGILGVERVEVTEGLSAGELIARNRIIGAADGTEVKVEALPGEEE